jgi:hypothetical protein
MGVLAQVENGDQFWKLKFHATNETAQHALRALAFFFLILFLGQPTKKGGLMFYCGTSMGVGDSLGISTGVGLLVWVSGLVLVFFFSFSFHSIERKLPECNSQHVL